MQFVVEQVPGALVLPLRQRVLRPHQPIAEVAVAGDAAGTHFAAFDESSVIVGVASVLPEPTPTTSVTAWRLRGMATTPEVRGEGVGRALLSAALEHVAQRGGELCWCMARWTAVGFYERAGFVQVGEEFEEPMIGPHVEMHRAIDSAGAAR